MHLKALEINGFKSFGKKIRLDFDAPISAIVGPNGSGKSNIAEAFRFALGEQSIKSMRGKKGGDLIFSGNQQIPKQARASVKVHFDNTDKRLPIDYDEVILERIVNHDGSNEYLINNSTVRLKDVSELLANANIGSSGHHIISQGEADRILNSSIKERKEILEDALGLRIFQYKKMESQRKLEKTLENIGQVESLRREIAPHIKFLKKQVEKIEQGRLLREELKTFYKNYLKQESKYLADEKIAIEQEIDTPVKRLQEIESQIGALQTRSETNQNNEVLDSIKSIELQLNAVYQNKNGANREMGQLEGELNSIEKIAERQRTIVPEESVSIQKTELENLKTEIEKFENSQSEDVNSLREIIKNILNTVRVFISSKVEHNDHQIDFSGDLVRIENQKRDLTNKIKEYEFKEIALRDALNKKREILEADKSNTVESEKKIIALMTEKNELQRVMSGFAIRRDGFERDEKAFKQELTEAAVLVGRDVLEYENIEINPKYLSQNREEQNENRRKLERMKIKVEEMGVGSGEEVLREFQEVEERDQFLVNEIADLEKSSASLNEIILDLENKIDTKFKEGIQKINSEFQKFFVLMFGGGNASLQVVKAEVRKKRDSDLDLLGNSGGIGDYSDGADFQIPEEAEEGIDLNVSLPKKKIKGLMMLSGGERALTSIALLFAISQVNPPPFIILDETDAALDESNSRKYSDMIENLSKYSQLILITHNRETMSRAGVLYGVTMINGVSQLLSIAFDEGVQWAK
jgi:chromosome segregation protein